MGKGEPKKPRRKCHRIFFVQTCREEYKKKHPDASVNFSEFSKKCSERWKTISTKEKGTFEDMAKGEEFHYERETKIYIPLKGETKKKFKDLNVPKRPRRPSSCSVLSIAPKSKENILAYPLKAAKLKEKYEKEIAAYQAKGKSDTAKKGVVKPKKIKKKKEEEEGEEDEEDEEETEDEKEEYEEDDDDE
ncbi:High mobility group protein B1 [Sciurus carolinensis]|uniref:High mobility group protein B1 n=1 Tax=Sciurus carolinensis TaxID=30640 RepID=A0AA41T3S9_SCICA|nr:High mobility group protein B1 [Sciurus carolinensis]